MALDYASFQNPLSIISEPFEYLNWSVLVVWNHRNDRYTWPVQRSLRASSDDDDRPFVVSLDKYSCKYRPITVRDHVKSIIVPNWEDSL